MIHYRGNLTEKETDEQLMNRQANYYWLGRYLRECVECCSIKNNRIYGAHSFKVYHGINKNVTFDCISCINGPFSTTKDQNVALNFCATEGIILEIDVTVPGLERCRIK